MLIVKYSCVCVCGMCGYMCDVYVFVREYRNAVCVWRSEKNLGCQSFLSALFGTRPLCCSRLCKLSAGSSSPGDSPVAIAHGVREGLGLKTNAHTLPKGSRI